MWWQKTKQFVSKYWQLLLGFLALVALLVKQMFDRRQQQDVLENEVVSNKRVEEINREFDTKIAAAEKAAERAGDQRIAEIKAREAAELRVAKEQALKREKENNAVSGDELANRFGETFGAEVVTVKDDE